MTVTSGATQKIEGTLLLPLLALVSICMKNKIHFNALEALLCFQGSTEGISWFKGSEDSCFPCQHMYLQTVLPPNTHTELA